MFIALFSLYLIGSGDHVKKWSVSCPSPHLHFLSYLILVCFSNNYHIVAIKYSIVVNDLKD